MLEVKKFINSVSELALDVETRGDSLLSTEVVMVQIGNDKIQYVLDARTEDITSVLSLIKRKNCKIYGHNLKYDYEMIKLNYGIELENLFCTYLASQLIETRSKAVKGYFTLESVCRRYIDPYAYSNQGNLFIPHITKSERMGFAKIGDDPFTKNQIVYGGLDAWYSYNLGKFLSKKLERLDLMKAAKMEFEFLKVLGDMELRGVKLDVNKWLEASKVSLEEAESMVNDLMKYKVINWDSPKQVVSAFQEFGISTEHIDKDTGEVKDSVSATAMAKETHPLVVLYLRYKKHKKIVSSYGTKFLSNVGEDGRIHPRYLQIKDTGRTGCSGPNLQNIPRGEMFRHSFVGEPSLLISDYSNQELRLLAEKTNETSMIKAFNEGKDLHSLTASKLFGREINKEDKDRHIGKTVNFSIAYGSGASNLSEQLDLSWRDSKQIIDKFFLGFPNLKKTFVKWGDDSRERGYVLISEQSGRKFFYEDYDEYVWCKNYIDYAERRGYGVPRKIKNRFGLLHSSYQRIAQNYTIQGTGAEMSKLAGIFMRKEGLKPVLLIHDEWVCEKSGENDLVVMKQCMEKAARIYLKKVTLLADVEESKMWKK